MSTPYQAQIVAYPIDKTQEGSYWGCEHKHKTEEAAATCAAVKARSFYVKAPEREAKHEHRLWWRVVITVAPWSIYDPEPSHEQ